MLAHEWLNCVDYLCENWKRYAEQFSSPRWQNRFGHLDRNVFITAVDAYADANLQAPTVDALVPFLPKGTKLHRPSRTHIHQWEPVADAILCNTCGKHGDGCHCASCECRHPRAAFDGYYGDEGGWMLCPDCTGTWINKRLKRPPQQPQPARMSPADQAWGAMHARWTTKALAGTLTPTEQIIGYDDIAKQYPELANDAKKAIIELAKMQDVIPVETPPHVDGFTHIGAVNPFQEDPRSCP